MLPVIINAAAGTGQSADGPESIEAAFRAAGMEARIVPVRPGQDLSAVAAEVARQKPAAIVAGGGDGTIRSVASALAGIGIPLGVLPLGTLNHFAKDLGIPLDLAEAARNIAAGHAVDVDVGEVNGRVFINNSSLGLYPHIVRHRDTQQRRLGRGKWPAFLWATLTMLRHSPFLNVCLSLDGAQTHCTTSFVFIGNNEYVMEGFDIGKRERLDAARLSIYTTRRRGRAKVLMLGLRALIGRLRQAKDFEALSAQTLVVETRHKRLHVATDGEVTVMDTPLEYAIRPGALRVLVPRPEEKTG